MRAVTFASREAQQIIEAHLSGVPMTVLAKERGFSIKPIKRLLKQNGIKPLNSSLKRSDVKGDIVVALYETGLSQSAIGERFGVTQTCIGSRLRRAGVKVRAQTTLRKHSIREEAFDEIGEESAYWAGFLMADGNVIATNGKHRVTVCLKAEDADHLRCLKRWLGATQEVVPYTSRCSNGTLVSMCVLSFSSRRIVEALATHGIVPRKSLTARASPLLALNRHFWRGVIDGDGCIGIYNRPIINLCGSRDLLEQYAAFARQEVGLMFRAKVRTVGKYCVFVLGSNNARIMAEHLYADCRVALARKLHSANRLIALSPTTQRNFN